MVQCCKVLGWGVHGAGIGCVLATDAHAPSCLAVRRVARFGQLPQPLPPTTPPCASAFTHSLPHWWLALGLNTIVHHASLTTTSLVACCPLATASLSDITRQTLGPAASTYMPSPPCSVVVVVAPPPQLICESCASSPAQYRSAVPSRELTLPHNHQHVLLVPHRREAAANGQQQRKGGRSAGGRGKRR